MCRAGFPGHLGEPWSIYDAVEIDFVIQYKHLTDAGCNVLTYAYYLAFVAKAASSPQRRKVHKVEITKVKMLSLCPLCLCGENRGFWINTIDPRRRPSLAH